MNFFDYIPEQLRPIHPDDRSPDSLNDAPKDIISMASSGT